MRSPIGYGPLEPVYPEASLKRGGKAKKKRATVDKSIKISIRNVQKQQEQRDIVHLMQGRVPPTPNMMPNSSRVFSAPSIHYAYAPPQYYGNAPSVTQPLTVMRDISTQRNVPKAEPEPDILTDVNPQGIRSGIDYTARAQPKSAERQYLDTVEDMRAKRDAETALEPFPNDIYDGDALMRQHDAVQTSTPPRRMIADDEEVGQVGMKPLFVGLTRLPERGRGPPSASKRQELEGLALPNRALFEQNLGLLSSATKDDLQNLMANYLYIPSKTGNTDVLREAIRASYGPAQASTSVESRTLRRGGMLGRGGSFGVFRK
jgi:hypothetical protein